MANNRKNNPIGIDRAIDQLQVPLFKKLQAQAELNGFEVNGFPRVYHTERDGDHTLEHYLGNGEYKDVMGGEDNRFFFYMHERVKGQISKNVRVDIICMVNLIQLMGNDGRRDEEFRLLVTEEIDRSRKFELKDTIIGMDYIQKLISPKYQTTNIAFSDIHPRHAVTFQTEVTYELKNC